MGFLSFLNPAKLLGSAVDLIDGDSDKFLSDTVDNAKSAANAATMGGSSTGGYGQLISSGLSFLGGTMTNQANSAQAQRQMDFQQRMSNTSYQRAVADMTAAGINPMLAYQNGGASTPSGASATMSDPITPALQIGLNSAKNTADIARITTQNKADNANIDNTNADTLLTKAQTAKTLIDSKLSENSAKKIATDTANAALETPGLKAQSAADSSWMGRQEKHFNNFMESVGHLNPFVSSAKAKSEVSMPPSPIKGY